MDGVKFFISVVEGATLSYHFTMQKRWDKWKIDNAPKIPEWIIKLEPGLVSAIEENDGNIS